MFISLNYACFSLFCISLPFAEMFDQYPLFPLFLLMMLLNNTKFRVFVALVSLTKNIIYFGQLSCIFLNVQGHFVLIDNHFC